MASKDTENSNSNHHGQVVVATVVGDACSGYYSGGVIQDVICGASFHATFVAGTEWGELQYDERSIALRKCVWISTKNLVVTVSILHCIK